MGVGVEVLDGVLEAAGGVRHRNGAVAHGVQLIQAARFETRRHEDDVAPGDDSVRHGHAEPAPPAEFVVVVALLRRRISSSNSGVLQQRVVAKSGTIGEPKPHGGTRVLASSSQGDCTKHLDKLSTLKWAISDLQMNE